MKEKILYLIEKIKELLKFGGPVVTVDLTDATNVYELTKDKNKEGEAENNTENTLNEEVAKDEGGFVNPNELAQKEI